MNPPARPAPPASGGFVELLHAQPTEMVSNFLLSFCKCFNVVINLFPYAQRNVMFANCQLRSVKFLKEMRLVEGALNPLNVNLNIVSLYECLFTHVN